MEIDTEKEFSSAETLLDKNRRRERFRNFNKPQDIPRARSKLSIKKDPCHYIENGVCKLSKEAYEKGLMKAVFPCHGNLQSHCNIRARADKGLTLEEIMVPG